MPVDYSKAENRRQRFKKYQDHLDLAQINMATALKRVFRVGVRVRCYRRGAPKFGHVASVRYCSDGTVLVQGPNGKRHNVHYSDLQVLP